MLPRHIYTLGNENHLRETADALGPLFYSGRAVNTVKFSDDSFQKIHPDDLASLVFLAHGSTQTYGGLEAREFANKISKQFQHKIVQKKYLHDVYLIGCDIGLIQNNKSFAQEVADELHKNGFTEVKVHSISQPEDALGETLYVDVIVRTGVIPTLIEGHINAYLFNQVDGDIFFNLLKDPRKNYKEIDKYKREHAFIFLKNAHPKTELDKPYNIFIPNEVNRIERIANDPYTKCTEKQNTVIGILHKRRDYLLQKAGKEDTKTARNLNFIATQIQRAQPTEWKDLITRYKSYLEIRIFGRTINMNSNTVKLLKHLSNEDLTAANKIISGQKSKKGYQFLREDDPIAHRFFEKTPLKKTKIAIVKLGDSSDEAFFSEAQAQISILKLILENEVVALTNTCLPCCNAYEITTKTQKINALRDLHTAKDWAGMRTKVALYVNDERVMQSSKTSRVRDLFMMLNDNPEKLLEDAAVEKHRYSIN